MKNFLSVLPGKKPDFPASEKHLQQAVKKYNGIDAKKVTYPWRFPDGGNVVAITALSTGRMSAGQIAFGNPDE